MTEVEFEKSKHIITDILSRSGLLNELKSKLRAGVFQAIQNSKDSAKVVEPTITPQEYEKLEMFKAFLKLKGLNQTLAVLEVEYRVSKPEGISNAASPATKLSLVIDPTQSVPKPRIDTPALTPSESRSRTRANSQMGTEELVDSPEDESYSSDKSVDMALNGMENVDFFQKLSTS